MRCPCNAGRSTAEGPLRLAQGIDAANGDRRRGRKVDHHRTQGDRALGNPARPIANAPAVRLNEHLRFIPLHARLRPGHADIGDVGGAAGEHTLIRGANVGVRSDDSGHASVKCVGEGDLLAH